MSKVLDLLNEQMNFEYESAYIYKAMAAYTDRLELDGYTHWFDEQVKEEIGHGEAMKHFLQEVGYDVRYKAIAEPDVYKRQIQDGNLAFGGGEDVIYISPKTGKRYVDESAERDVLDPRNWHHLCEAFACSVSSNFLDVYKRQVVVF